MHSVTPYPYRNPLLWALTDLAGLTLTGISRRSGVPPATLRRIVLGYDAKRSHQLSLLRTLDWARNCLAAEAQPLRDDPPPIREYRRALFAVLEQIMIDCQPAAEVERARAKAHRDTGLTETLLREIGRGRRRREVLGAMIRAHSSGAVRRRARGLGIRSVMRAGEWWWLPLPDLPPAALPAAVPSTTPAPVMPPRSASLPRQPTSTLQRQICDHVAIYLGRQPDFSAEAKEVVAHVCERTGASPAYVYRAANMIRLQRERRGYAATLRMWWTLPPAGDQSAPAPPPPSVTNFRRSRAGD